MSESLVDADAHPYHCSLQRGIKHMQTSEWFERVMLPLYDSNTWTRMAFNTLIPQMNKHLQDPGALTSAMGKANANPKNTQKLVEEYVRVVEDLKSSCVKHTKRCDTEKITDRMQIMRSSIQDLYEQRDIYEGMQALYVTNGIARTVYNLMIKRMAHSLLHDTDIATSNDIPSALIGM